jgi:Putative collagen-binding domain of a collagenase
MYSNITDNTVGFRRTTDMMSPRVKYQMFIAVFFLAVASAGARAAIVIDPQYPHSFKYDNGTRYFPMGDTAYFLLGQSQATIQKYIDSRSAHKFNFIRIGAVGNGFWPFGGSPSNPNYLTINETAMQKLDWLFTYAASKGINIDLLFWTYGKDGGCGMWGNTKYENFWVDTIVNRYKNRMNLFMYTVTNEFERYPNDVYSYASSDVDWARRVASRIKSIDSVHAVGVHPSHWTSHIPPYNTFKIYNGITQHLPQVVWPLWQNSDVTVLNTQNSSGVHKNYWANPCPGGTSGCATYESTDWQGINYPVTWTSSGWDFEGAGMEDSIAEDWLHGKPIINTEFGYQFESGITASDRGFYTHQLHQPKTVRKKAWKIASAGGFFAAGFAHTAVDFNASLVDTWRPGQLEILYNFFTQKTEYWKMAPHLELVSNLNSLLALPGTEYIAYFPRGGTNYINLQSGNYSVEWLNPETGAYSISANVKTLGGNYTFTPPNNIAADWVLHLKKSITSPPARKK